MKKYMGILALALVLALHLPMKASPVLPAPACPAKQMKGYKWYPKDCQKKAPLRHANA